MASCQSDIPQCTALTFTTFTRTIRLTEMETNTLLIMSNFKVICYLFNAEANASHSLVCFAVSVCLFAASHLAAAALWVLRVVVLLLGDQGLLTLFIIYLYNICENRQYNIVRTYDCRKTRQNNCIYGSPSTAYNSAVAPPSYCRTLLGGYILRVTHLVGLPSACCSDDQKCLKSCLALFFRAVRTRAAYAVVACQSVCHKLCSPKNG